MGLLDIERCSLMFRNHVRRMAWVASILAAGSMLGCETEQLMQERDALWQQNEELQDELARTRTALLAAETDRDQLAAEAQQLRHQVAHPPQPIAPVAVTTPQTNAFSGIEGVETSQEAGRVTVRIPGDVLFNSGSAALKKSAQKTLNQIAGVLQREYSHNTVRIEGYTDTDPIRKSRWTDNLALSMERAAAVHRYLQKKDVDPQRLEAVGLGQWFPKSSKAKSRRVQIVVLVD